MLNDLEREGLVARVRDDADRRRNLFAAHARAHGQSARWDARVEAAQTRCSHRFRPRSVETLASLLERVVAHHRG